MMRFLSACSLLLLVVQHLSAQSPADSVQSLAGADSSYVGKYARKNMVRLFYGARGNSLTYESYKGSSPNLQGSLYRNIGDYLGFGITYRWIDVDASIALPGTTYLKEERSNLEQFNLSARFTTRRLAFRGYYMDATGVVSASANDQYVSPPAAHESRLGIQMMYFLNGSRYSYRAALYQNEVQRRSAGSFLIGTEVFYRDLSTSQGLSVASYDIAPRYGDQAGMKTLQAPGILLTPGYAYTKVWKEGRYFVSGLLSAGAGVAFNRYHANAGSNTRNNLETAANLMFSGGYNGPQYFVRVLVLAYSRYELIDPAFLMSTNLMVDVMVGWRFGQL